MWSLHSKCFLWCFFHACTNYLSLISCLVMPHPPPLSPPLCCISLSPLWYKFCSFTRKRTEACSAGVCTTMRNEKNSYPDVGEQRKALYWVTFMSCGFYYVTSKSSFPLNSHLLRHQFSLFSVFLSVILPCPPPSFSTVPAFIQKQMYWAASTALSLSLIPTSLAQYFPLSVTPLFALKVHSSS